MQTNCHSFVCYCYCCCYKNNNNNKRHQILSKKNCLDIFRPAVIIYKTLPNYWQTWLGAFFACGHVNITSNKVISIYWWQFRCKINITSCFIDKNDHLPTCRGEKDVIADVKFANLSWLQAY